MTLTGCIQNASCQSVCKCTQVNVIILPLTDVRTAVPQPSSEYKMMDCTEPKLEAKKSKLWGCVEPIFKIKQADTFLCSMYNCQQ